MKPTIIVTLLALVVICFNLLVEPLPKCAGCDRNNEWRKFQRKLAYEVATGKNEYDVVFLGDSITEAFRGTAGGDAKCSSARCEGIPSVFNKAFNTSKKIVLAISGDQTAHLQWRLNHGEKQILKKAKSVVLHIGTNDLSQLISPHVGGWWSPLSSATLTKSQVDDAAQTVITRLLDVIYQLRCSMKSNGKLVIVGLLPRGQSFKPPTYNWPNNLYTEAIGKINEAIKENFECERSTHVSLCTEPFLGDGKIREDLMADALHPTAEGSKLLIGCIKEGLKSLGVA
eukprot:TRINITY_DN1705_c0_g1_i4.p1 TRINITY_DN1705_c0_g1~~TRINITY_DN1705_c0_g1_i4.p1  ORF type:complete len:304 (+),score=43.52 TRINITY_DN1705_c0_g1_i4:59-913(+)